MERDAAIDEIFDAAIDEILAFTSGDIRLALRVLLVECIIKRCVMFCTSFSMLQCSDP